MGGILFEVKVSNHIPIAERFWSKVNKRGADECWEWTAAVNWKGYGVFHYIGKSKNILAHREAYALTFGDPPPDIYVLHRCDNPPCCNPAHLWLGTNKDNVKDMVSKGRHHSQSHPENLPHGERHHNAKFTSKQISEVKEARRHGLTYKAIGSLFNMSATHAHNIVTNKSRNQG